MFVISGFSQLFFIVVPFVFVCGRRGGAHSGCPGGNVVSGGICAYVGAQAAPNQVALFFCASFFVLVLVSVFKSAVASYVCNASGSEF